MRNDILKISLVVFFVISIVSCDSEEVTDQNSIEFLDNKEAELIAKMDSGVEVLADLTLQAFEDEENTTKSARERFLPDCAIVTVVLEDAYKKVTIDFGSEGCEGRNGHIIKGKIHMNYKRDITAQSVMIDYSLEDFFVDGAQLEGSKSINRVRENENGNPERTMILDLNFILQDGSKISRTGTRTREWIDGVLNGNWGDNVFLITGSWKTSFASGLVHTTTITTPIRREASCRFAVSGVKEIIRSRFSGSLDYGDGTCDNKAMFTNSDGEKMEIRL